MKKIFRTACMANPERSPFYRWLIRGFELVFWLAAGISAANIYKGF